MAACSGGSAPNSFGAGEQKKADEQDAGPAPSPNPDKKADVPEQVSGAFLTCAYLDDANTAVANATAGKNVDFGCGFFHKTSTGYNPVDVGQEQLSSQVVCNSDAPQTVGSRRSDVGVPLPLTVSVSVAQLSCSLQVTTTDSAARSANFVMSIKNMRYFGARTHFDIDEYVTTEGLNIVSGQPLGQQAQGAQSSPNDTSVTPPIPNSSSVANSRSSSTAGVLTALATIAALGARNNAGSSGTDNTSGNNGWGQMQGRDDQTSPRSSNVLTSQSPVSPMSGTTPSDAKTN